MADDVLVDQELWSLGVGDDQSCESVVDYVVIFF